MCQNVLNRQFEHNTILRNHTNPQQKLYIRASAFTPIKTSIVSGVALNSYCLISWRNTKATLKFAGVMKVSNGVEGQIQISF